MRRLSCTTNAYDRIYAPWIVGAGELLDLAAFDPRRHSLLDLCGGTGAVAQEAIKRGADPARIVVRDLNPRADRLRVRQERGSAEDLNADGLYDVIVCRQAIGYVQNVPQMSERVARALRNGGVFVCNSPNPDRVSRTRVRGRWFGGALFLEWHWRTRGDDVLHVQARIGRHPGVDVTRFHLHSELEMMMAFSKSFEEVRLCRRRTSLHWRCTREEESCVEC